MNLDEFGLIRRMVSSLPANRSDVRVGIGDDAAVLEQVNGEDLLMTTDTMVAGVHFREDTMSYADVGFKAVAASISDIAAMGGDAKHAVVAIAVPKDIPLEALDQLYAGIGEVCQKYGCSVVGGDVVATDGPMVVTTTILGGVPKGQALLRSGARPGDVVFVTGELGSSAVGLATIESTRQMLVQFELDVLRNAHRRPTPQVVAGEIFRICQISSCNDVSDGLASELNEIATASAVRLRIDATRVPIAVAVRNYARNQGKDPLEYALYGGEDYQLVGTASQFSFARALAMCEVSGVHLTQIGRVESGEGVVLTDAAGQYTILEARGYNHFSEES